VRRGEGGQGEHEGDHRTSHGRTSIVRTRAALRS
jgi:hypothetical protein